MIVLSKGIFAPWVILLSMVLLPFCIGGLIVFCVRLDYVLLNMAIVFSLVYLLAIWFAKKHSKSGKYYMMLNDDELIIKYPDMQDAKNEIIINRNQILRIEYYRICSLRSWCMLYNYILPQCAYITYWSGNKEICRHIGYPSKIDLIAFCRKTGIQLTQH